MELSYFRAWLLRLDEREIRYVRAVVASSHRPFVKKTAALVCRLGNGWLYLGLTLSVLLVEGWEARFILGWTSLTGAITFPLYWMLKKVSARSRPFHRDPSLDSGLRILDLYSFPSGHCMTAAAVGLPYGLTFRYAFVPFLIGWLLIAWSRLASGHHYPSDILFGSLIGGAISLGVLVFIT